MANVPFLCSDYLYCPVCLDLFREPVTIPCGHTFCLTCITQCWSLQGMPASCPQCRSCFQQESSPRLCKNSILSQMVDDFSKLQGATERMAVGNMSARSVGIPLKTNFHQDESEENIGSEASISFAIPSSGENQESSSTQVRTYCAACQPKPGKLAPDDSFYVLIRYLHLGMSPVYT